MIKCFAHRGYSSKAPENTIAAFNLALNTPGITGIEIDVQLTKDLVPIIIHDFRVDRVTNGNGYVKDYTYKEIKELDAGTWFDNSFKWEKIPCLEEVLKLIKGKKELLIEIKSNGREYPEIEKKVIEMVKKYDMVSEVYIKSFNHQIVERIKKIDSSIKTGLLISGHPTLLDEQVKNTGSSFISMPHYYLDRETVDLMYSHGIEVMAWTVNTEDAIDNIINLDSNITIISNYPDRVLKRQDL